MASLLDIKNFVASQMGRADGATPNAKRDTLINRARSRFYNERRWSFLRKTASVSLTNKQGNLPSDYNLKFDPYSVYHYVGKLKYEYTKVEWDDVEAHGDGFYVFAIDRANKKIKINNSTVSSVDIDYTIQVPDAALNGSEDSVAEYASDISAIGLLATAYQWLSAERSTGKYQMFMDEYEKMLAQMIANDAATQPVRRLRGTRIDSGYTRGSTDSKRGYYTPYL